MGTAGAPLFLLAAFFGGLAAVTRWRRRVGPNEALVVFGRGRTAYDEEGRPVKLGGRIVTAGGTIVLPVLEEAQKLDLRVMTIFMRLRRRGSPDKLKLMGSRRKVWLRVKPRRPGS